MLYSGFNILPRSVFWSACFNGRSDNLDVIPPGRAQIKIRLSTLLLFIALIAVACGWLVDRNFDSAVIGDWYYPTPETLALGHSSELSIRANRTFSLVVSGPNQSRTFSGTWRRIEKYEFLFHITRRKDRFFKTDARQAIETEADLDLEMRCRYSVDSGGYLLTSVTAPVSVEVTDPSHLSFESVYCPLK